MKIKKRVVKNIIAVYSAVNGITPKKKISQISKNKIGTLLLLCYGLDVDSTAISFKDYDYQHLRNLSKQWSWSNYQNVTKNKAKLRRLLGKLNSQVWITILKTDFKSV